MGVFIIVSLCVFGLFHFVVYRGLFAPLCADSRRLKRLCVGLLAFNFALIALFMLCRGALVSPFFVIALSLSIYLALLGFAFGALNLFFVLLARFFPKIWRIRPQKSAQILLFLLGFCFVWGIYNAHKTPVLNRQDIVIKGLSGELKILVITDLHLSNLITQGKVEATLNLANATKPDIIVLVGDIIDEKERVIAHLLPLLGDLRAKFGVYFVLGNHEFLHEANESLRLIESLQNIVPLVNESRVVDGRINLIGLSDLSGVRHGYLPPDIAKATQNLAPSLPNIALSHQPNAIKLLDSRIDLMISGHTHGGQVAPFSLAAWLANPFLWGLKTINETQVFISRGAGVAVTYARLFADSEINLITLKGE